MARPKEFDREKALDKAMRLFWHRGYEATSVQELCDCMGINRGSLYDTFGDKRSLFLSALDRYMQSYAPTFDFSSQTLSGMDAIQEIFAGVVEESVADENRCGCMVANTIIELAPHDAEIAAISEANRNSYETLFHNLLIRAKQDGELTHRQDLRMLARFLVNVFYGLRVTAKTTNDREILTDIVNTSLSLLR